MRLQPLSEESTDGIQRKRCRFQLADTHDKSMRHPYPHIKFGINTRANCPINIPARVIQENFVIADMNADGRHARKSTMQG